MFDDFFKKVFGTRFKREMKRISPTVAAIHRHEERLKTLPDGELQAQTARFRAMVAERTGALAAEVVRLTKAKHDCPDAVERATLSDQLGKAEQALARALQATLDDLLSEVFATVREASRRLLGTPVAVTGHTLTWTWSPTTCS